LIYIQDPDIKDVASKYEVNPIKQAKQAKVIYE
jgi:hypothetical protein